MAQEKVHGGMEAGINLDEDNHAQIPSHRGYVNGQKQHKKENLTFQAIGQSKENELSHWSDVSSHNLLHEMRDLCIYIE